MTLETALTYLVAVAVPVWLLVEQILTWRQAAREREAATRSVFAPGSQPAKREPASAPRGVFAVGFPRKAA
jgi:hypothetical protein